LIRDPEPQAEGLSVSVSSIRIVILRDAPLRSDAPQDQVS